MTAFTKPLPWLLLLSFSLVAPTARGDKGDKGEKVDKNVCVAAYVAAQSLRVDGHLLEAQKQLSICGQTGCPASISNDCARWQGEVSSSLGSLVIVIQTPPGVDPATARVKLDGRALTAAEQAGEVLVDLGTHALEIEAPGCTPHASAVSVAAGQRGKRAEAALVCGPGPAPAGSAPQAGAPQAGAPQPSRAPLLLAATVGVVGAGVFSYFALSTKSRENSLRSDCAPACATADVDALRRRYLIADFGLLLGVAGLATAGVLWFTAPSSTPETSASFGVSPAGPSLQLRGSF